MHNNPSLRLPETGVRLLIRQQAPRAEPEGAGLLGGFPGE